MQAQTDVVECRVSIAASQETVFSFFTDPEKMMRWQGMAARLVAQPGGEFWVDLDDGVVMSGKFVELDPERRRIRLEGKATEKSGGGQVRMVMESTVESLGEQRARVVVDVDVRLAGKIVRFGRGMIGVVAERLFRDFAECLAATLGADVAGADLEDGAGAASADASPAARSAHAAASLNPVLLLFRALWSRLSRLFGRGG